MKGSTMTDLHDDRGHPRFGDIFAWPAGNRLVSKVKLAGRRVDRLVVDDDDIVLVSIVEPASRFGRAEAPKLTGSSLWSTSATVPAV
jgi:hypothetical protein